MVYHYTALTLTPRLLLHCSTFYLAALQSPSLDHGTIFEHINMNNNLHRIGTMAVMHVPPIVAQSVVFVLDGSCLQSRHIGS